MKRRECIIWQTWKVLMTWLHHKVTVNKISGDEEVTTDMKTQGNCSQKSREAASNESSGTFITLELPCRMKSDEDWCRDKC